MTVMTVMEKKTLTLQRVTQLDGRRCFVSIFLMPSTIDSLENSNGYFYSHKSFKKQFQSCSSSIMLISPLFNFPQESQNSKAKYEFAHHFFSLKKNTCSFIITPIYCKKLIMNMSNGKFLRC